jgi:succinate dehydrogenase / fumarate reductase flavoprotein subunit/fumarate reductase (CoM/CoB) subunit A
LAAAEFSRHAETLGDVRWESEILDGIRPRLEGNGKGHSSPAMLQNRLQNLMWEEAGPLRAGAKLSAALERIRRMRDEELAHVNIGPQKSYNLDMLDWFELRAMLMTAQAVVSSALARAESRGAHQREDFPASDAAFLKNQIVELIDGKLRSRWAEPMRLSRSGGGDG